VGDHQRLQSRIPDHVPAPVLRCAVRLYPSPGSAAISYEISFPAGHPANYLTVIYHRDIGFPFPPAYRHSHDSRYGKGKWSDGGPPHIRWRREGEL